jgi:hypothetical protein
MNPGKRKSNPEKNLSNNREAYLQEVGWIRDKKLLGYRPKEKLFC